MSQKRLGQFVFGCSLIAAATLGTWLSKVSFGQTSIQPFTITISEAATGEISGGRFQKALVLKRRRDGSHAKYHLDELSRLNTAQIREIVLVPEKTRILVDDSQRSLTTSPLTTRELEKAAMSSNQTAGRCEPKVVPEMTPDYLGQETLMGIETHHYRFPRSGTSPASYVVEAWFAPVVGCIEVQQTALRYDATSNRLTSTFRRQLINASLGEPDQTGFSFGINYKESKPSTLYYNNLVSTQKIQPTGPMKSDWARMDAAYSAVHLSTP